MLLVDLRSILWTVLFTKPNNIDYDYCHSDPIGWYLWFLCNSKRMWNTYQVHWKVCIANYKYFDKWIYIITHILHYNLHIKICVFVWSILSSWDAKAAHDLPECIKFALGKILDSFQTIENMLHQEEKYRMSYLKYFVRYCSHLYLFLFERNIFVINHLQRLCRKVM